MRYKYNPETGYVSLSGAVLTSAPETVTVEGLCLVRKTEFHVSIMALKHLAPMLTNLSIDDATKQLVQYFFNFIATHDMKNISLTGEFRLVRKDERVTIVAMVNMPYLEELFDGLRSHFEVNFSTQPAHITLYTLQPDAGIELLSESELDSKSAPITITQLNELGVCSSD